MSGTRGAKPTLAEVIRAHLCRHGEESHYTAGDLALDALAAANEDSRRRTVTIPKDVLFSILKTVEELTSARKGLV